MLPTACCMQHVLLLVTGESKAEALAKMIAADHDDAAVPAAALRAHANTDCICDRKAAARLGVVAAC
jgi:6-phosphogluconolactonase/glucosamine-6-phosphate isomerase/deaminase